MIKSHPEILKRDGKEQFAVLLFEEFLAMQELIEDMEHLRRSKKQKQWTKANPEFR